MDIIDQAAEWADEYMTSDSYAITTIRQDLIKAWLAGNASVECDYSPCPRCGG